MKKIIKILLTVSLLIIFCSGYTQNIVPNPSFEKLDSCPKIYGGSYYLHLQNWTGANLPIVPSTPDLYHCCFHFTSNWNLCESTAPYRLAPRTGEGYVGIFVFYPDTSIVDVSEYIQVKLKQPFVPGKQYKISLWAHLRKYCPDYMYIAVNSELLTR